MLKLYPGGKGEVKILPKLDRLLLFWSDRRNPHEVEPSHDVRLVCIHVDFTQRFVDVQYCSYLFVSYVLLKLDLHVSACCSMVLQKCIKHL